MLRFSVYEKEFERLLTQFEFIRYAFSKLSISRRQAFLRGKRKKAEEIGAQSALEMLAPFEHLKKHFPDFEKKLIRNASRGAAEGWFPRDLGFWEELAHDALNQTELLLLVAYFESFMKAFHRHLLRSNPNLLAVCKPDAQRSLKDVFHRGYDAFVRGEIEKQVKDMNAQRIAVRADRFKKLGIEWGNKEIISKLSRIAGYRNQISHGISSTDALDSDVSYEDRLDNNDVSTIPPDVVLLDARKFFLAVPRLCCSQAGKQYKKYFENPG